MSILPCTYVNTTNGRLHVRHSRPRPGALPLVLLHQTASSSLMYEALIACLEADFFCIAPDTPGFGNSYRPQAAPTVAEYAQAIREGLTVLGVERCHLFGHHTGAAIAVQLASDHPEWVATLLLSGPPLLSQAQIEALRERLRPRALSPTGSHLQAVWETLRGRDPSAPLELIQRETILTLQAAEQYSYAYQAVFAQDFAGQLAQIRGPVLLMAGEYDTLRDSLEPAAAACPQAQVHLIPDGTTYLCDRQPEVVAGLIRQFCCKTQDD